MEHIDDNTRVTLTVRQLKRLVNENEPVPVKRAKTEADALFVCEMSNKWKAETLLPMNIWIDENKTYVKGGHSKRIKFQLNDSGRMDMNHSGEMDLDGKVWPESLVIRGLHAQQLTQLRNFVHNNRYALEKVADVLIPLFEIWPFIIKGGKIASKVDIKALNDKVDELIKSHENEK